MSSTTAPSKAELRKALEDEVRFNRSMVAAASKLQTFHTDLLDRSVRALSIFDTLELPNLFPSCPTNPPTESPTSEN